MTLKKEIKYLETLKQSITQQYLELEKLHIKVKKDIEDLNELKNKEKDLKELSEPIPI